MPKSKKAQIVIVGAKTNKNKNRAKRENTRLGTALRALGQFGGTTVGGLIGQPALGGSTGRQLGASLSRWLGSGDYTVAENSIVTSTLRGSSSVPMMHQTDQSIVVRHRELVSVLQGKGVYTVRAALHVNPGLADTFPWLCAIAANYQEYRIRGLVFHYVPTSGMATGANTALGSVMFQTVYRATDSVPASKYELLNEFWSNECLPSEGMAHPLECKVSETIMPWRYVRTGNVTDDLMFYDYGVTTVAVQGQQTDNQIIGDLWVSYEIELRKPKLALSLGTMVKTCKVQGPTGSLYTAAADKVFDSLNGSTTMTMVVGTSTTHTVIMSPGNAGKWMYAFRMYNAAGTGTNSGVSPVPTLTNATLRSYEATAPYITQTRVMGWLSFVVVDPTVGVTLSWTTYGTNSATLDLLQMLNQFDADIV